MSTGDQICPSCGGYFCDRTICGFIHAVDELVAEVQMSVRPKRQPWENFRKPRFDPEGLPDIYEPSAEEEMPNDPVNNPSHYTSGGIETIDAIEAWGLDNDFCLANTVKYISRAGKKDPSKLLEDLKKARWYLDRRISKLEKDSK